MSSKRDEQQKEGWDFWLVWNQDGRVPRFRHKDKLAAEREAERLARMNPGERFYLCYVESYVVAGELTTVKLKEDVPF